jgi:hypothetical protein
MIQTKHDYFEHDEHKMWGEEQILVHEYKLQNISCKMNREVLHWFTEFYTSWNETNHILQNFNGILLEKDFSWNE